MTCPKLQPPRDGFFVQDTCDNVFHAGCGVKCEPGYKLVGSSVRLCEADGVWSGEPAKCEGNFKEGRYSCAFQATKYVREVFTLASKANKCPKL